MKLNKSRRAHSLAFNMTPMIDIVFLLIIFFMTVAQITRTVDSPVQLPLVRKGAEAPRPVRVTINLDDRGRILVAGRRLSLDDCVEAIQQRLGEGPADAVQIQIRCDRACPSRHVNQLVERLAAIGVVEVRVAVARE